MTPHRVFLIVCLLLLPSTASAITSGQVDDFEDGTAMGWSEGFFSPNPPTNAPNGGPGGVGDNYLRNVSTGQVATAGGRMVMFNQVQWTGDYVTAGVSAIQIMMANFGTTTLSMRIAVEGSGTRFGSTNAFTLPADGQWRSTVFNLGAGDLSLISGAATLNSVLSTVTTLRILSRASGSGWQGDEIAGTLGVDNIRAAATSGVSDPVSSPVQLLANTPNPFTTATMIRYTLTEDSPVRIEVFDLHGRFIRSLESTSSRKAGTHEVSWDGRNNEGVRVTAGMYFYQLRSSRVVETRRMLILPGS